MAPELVTKRFLLAEKHDRIEKFHAGHKAIFKRDTFLRPGVHRPVAKARNQKTVDTNGSGLTKDEFHFADWRSIDPKKRELAQINHYIVKDPRSFVLKVSRGRAHQIERKVSNNYWINNNHNSESDSYLADNDAKLVAEMARLDKASGGVISSLTSRSYNRHFQRFPGMLDNPELRDLYIFCLENNYGKY